MAKLFTYLSKDLQRYGNMIKNLLLRKIFRRLKHGFVVVGASASQSFARCSSTLSRHTKNIKTIHTVFLFDTQHGRNSAEKNPASLLIVPLDETLKETPSFFPVSDRLRG